MKTAILKQVKTAVQKYFVRKQFSYSTDVCMCATYSLLGTPILSVVIMRNRTLYDLLQMVIPLLLCRQQGGGANEKTYGIRNRR